MAVKYYTIRTPNRDGFISVGHVHDVQKRFRQFNADPYDPANNLSLMRLYANALCSQVSERLDVNIAPFIKERVNDKVNESSFAYDLHLIHGPRDIKYRFGDCIIRSTIDIDEDVITRNMVHFEQLSKQDASLIDIIKRVSDQFASKASLEFNYSFVDSDYDPIKILLHYGRK